MRKLAININLVVFFILCSVYSYSQKTYYVSTTGADNAAGTITAPFATVTKAISVVSSGDTIYIRGGLYSLGSTLSPTVSGSSGKYNCLWAYPGEVPVLNFSSEIYAPNVVGVNLSAGYWYLKGLTIENAGDNGIYITGNNNIVENCQVSNSKDTGIQISGAGANNNYIHNCDSYGNNDPATGGQNADGIDVKLFAGAGNVIRGCRVYDNADDGYDCYETANRVVFDSCWSFHNGYNLWNIPNFTGNGNGFKLGGNFYAGPHLVTNCVAFDNPVKGFDQNNNIAGVTLYNCTSFRNGTYDFSFPTQPSVGQDTLENNIGYLSQGVHLESNAIDQFNSWDGNYTVSDASFLSLDTSFARIVRIEGGYIPPTTFLRLAPGGNLIDGGTNVGIPFLGAAPDLGAFESGSEVFMTQLLPLSGTVDTITVTLNWGVSYEFNNTGWVIERELPGSNQWQDIGFTTSLGNIATGRSYSYVDNSIREYGNYQYRLKQVNADSSIVYSNVIVLDVADVTPVVTQTSPLFVFPNPITSNGIIQFYIPENERVSLRIYNSSGQLVKVVYNNWFFFNSNVYNIPFDISQLARGVYIVKMNTDDGVDRIARILKE